jgi:FAD/FMN-containing dehydrogenase
LIFNYDGTSRPKQVFTAHAGAGEVHLRPVLNLKTRKVHQFRNIATEAAFWSKKYRVHAEHGDGIVRGEFACMIGQKNYELLKRIKFALILLCIMNEGKIVNAFKMDENLRFEAGRLEPEIKTIQDFR